MKKKQRKKTHRDKILVFTLGWDWVGIGLVWDSLLRQTSDFYYHERDEKFSIEIVVYTQREQPCTARSMHALDHFAWA